MLSIRPVTDTELGSICSVHERAFGRPQEARLVALLHQAGKAVISLVAVSEGVIAGSIVFSAVAIDVSGELRWLGLGPLAVLPEYQKTGVGSALIREGLRHCTSAGYDVVVVLGDPRYYSRFGFSRGADYWLGNEYGADEAFQVVELRTNALRGIRGVVRYAEEFAASSC
jgi:putative acetyltransferase